LIQIANHFKGTQVLSRPSPKVHAHEADMLTARHQDRKAPSAPLEMPRPADIIC